MNKDSIIDLQKIDCNCNDCKFMVRDIDEFKKAMERHHKWQFDYFNVLKNNMIKKAKWWRNIKNDLEKWDALTTEAEKLKFQFDKSEVSINYGFCSKFNTNVQFIPNTCQLHTQTCFVHRKNE